jgi:hypothetical protein
MTPTASRTTSSRAVCIHTFLLRFPRRFCSERCLHTLPLSFPPSPLLLTVAHSQLHPSVNPGPEPSHVMPPPPPPSNN